MGRRMDHEAPSFKQKSRKKELWEKKKGYVRWSTLQQVLPRAEFQGELLYSLLRDCNIIPNFFLMLMFWKSGAKCMLGLCVCVCVAGEGWVGREGHVS